MPFIPSPTPQTSGEKAQPAIIHDSLSAFPCWFLGLCSIKDLKFFRDRNYLLTLALVSFVLRHSQAKIRGVNLNFLTKVERWLTLAPHQYYLQLLKTSLYLFNTFQNGKFGPFGEIRKGSYYSSKIRHTPPIVPYKGFNLFIWHWQVNFYLL